VGYKLKIKKVQWTKQTDLEKYIYFNKVICSADNVLRRYFIYGLNMFLSFKFSWNLELVNF